MPYQGFTDGLYFLKRPCIGKAGLDHYGILDIGNHTRHPQADGIHPVIIEMKPPHLQIRWFGPSDGIWTIEGPIADEQAAIERLHSAFRSPGYHWFGNNCEHFARFVATGARESRQVQSGVALAGLVLTLTALWPENE